MSRKYRRTWALALFPLVAASACGGGDDGADGTPISVAFAAEVDGAAFACGTAFDVGNPASSVEFADMRFYVHDVEIIDGNGDAVPIRLDTNAFQHSGVALLDFEDASGACDGNSATNPEVVGTIPEGTEATGLRFKVGVPFDLNHGREADSPSPLNLSDMFWAWKDGYKFVRVDAADADHPGLRLHLGSTGCETDADGRTTECAHPNIATVAFDAFDAGAMRVVFDAGTLFAESDTTMNTTKTPIGCMSDADDADCASIFAALGLPFGDTAAGVATAFTVAPKP